MDTSLVNFSAGLLLWQTLMILVIVLAIIALIDIMNNDFIKN